MKSLFVGTTVLLVTVPPLLLYAQQKYETDDGVFSGRKDATSPAAVEETAPAPSPSSDTVDKDKQIAELNDRLDLLEDDMERLLGELDKQKKESKEDKLNWSGSYRFGVNVFRLHDHMSFTQLSYLMLQVDDTGAVLTDPDTGAPVDPLPVYDNFQRDTDEWLSPSMIQRLRLALAYNPTDNLRFYARLSVFKYFNEIKNTDGIIDLNSNAYPRDASLRLERVFVDWFPTKWLAFSAGRVSASDGPPAELKENCERSSGWGLQMVQAEMEVVMTTFHLTKLLEGTYLRFFYAPFGLHSDYIMSRDTSLFDSNGITPLHGWGTLFEIKLPHLGDNVMQMGLLHVPKFGPRDIDLYLPGSNIPISPSAPDGTDLGTILNASTLLMFKDIFGIGLDIFGAYAITVLKPREGRMVYNIPTPIYHPVAGDTGLEADVPYEIGLASYEEGNGTVNYGHFAYGGLRQTLPISKKYPTRIGGELNWGTKYHIAWSVPSDQLVNKLATKGWAWEAYVIQQLVPEYMFFRVGYIDIKKDYDGLYLGPTSKVDRRINNIYLIVDLSW